VGVKSGRITEHAMEQRLAMITPQLTLNGFDQADLIVEAVFENLKVKHVVLLGQDAPLIDAVLKDVCSTELTHSMPQAVQAAARSAQAGDTVLLSPACASLDMFRDYAHRGDVFAAAVKELAA